MPGATVADVVEAVGELRHEIKTKGEGDQEKFDKLEKTFAEWDDIKQVALLEREAAKTAAEENEQRMKVLESELAKRSGGSREEKDHKLDAEWKAADQFYRLGLTGVEDKAQLRTDVDTSAGYLVPDAVDTNLLKKITELDPMRALASVMTISTKSIEIVVEDSIPVATYEGELESASNSEAGYENVTLTPFAQTFQSRVTQDQLMNSGWDMEAQMSMGASTAFALGEGNGFTVGTGFKVPEGFTVNATVLAAAIDTATADTFVAADVLTLWGSLKIGYNGTFQMNRLVMAAIRKFVSTGGVFLWEPGLNGPVANTLCGDPYVLTPSMSSDVTTTDSIMLAYGDWRIGYRIVDRTGMTIIRDDITQALKRNVLITYSRWNTGRVVLPEAIKIMTIK